jgi:hypothetical protein
MAVFVGVGMLLRGAGSASAAPSASGGWVLVGIATWKKHARANPAPGNPNYGIVTTSSGAGTYTNGPMAKRI